MLEPTDIFQAEKESVVVSQEYHFKDLSGNVMSETGQAVEPGTLHPVFIQLLFYLPVDSR